MSEETTKYVCTKSDGEEITRIVNRHKARIMTNLKQAKCPSVFAQAVAFEWDWMRSDIANVTKHATHATPDPKKGCWNMLREKIKMMRGRK